MLKIVLYQLFIRNWIANFSSISKKYQVSFPPPPFSLYPLGAHTLFKLPFARAFHFRNRTAKWTPAHSICPPFSPRKIFFSLVQHKLSRNYDSFVPSTMLIGMRVHARAAGPPRWSAHISTRRLQNGAYTRLTTPLFGQSMCQIRYYIVPLVAHASPNLDNVSRRGAVF